MSISLVISLAMLVSSSSIGQTAPVASEGALQLQAGQKQLFLDDYVVANIANLEHTMHRPEKRGAVIKPDIPSDGDLIQVRSAPMWVPDEQVYKLLYLACARDGANVAGVALATSKDGLAWEKPVLGETEVFGSKENNWIAKEPDLTWPRNCIEGVVYDPDDPDPNRRYKALLGAINRQPIVSPDCVHWTKLDVPEIPSSDESQLVYDRDNKRFLAMVKGSNEFGRAFNLSMSEDFVHWSAPRFLFGADAADQPMARDVIRKRLADPGLQKTLFVEPDPDTGWTPPAGVTYQPTWRVEVYNIPVFPYEGVYIGLPTMYYPTGTDLPARNNTDGFDLIQLATSRDLTTWTRLGDRQPFIDASRIDNGRVGVFDRGQILATNRPVEHDGELWFYYTGLKWRSDSYQLNPDGTDRAPNTLSPDEQADLKEGWGAVCLAVLRRDGFISLDAGENPGHVLTKPLILSGNTLFLNLDAPKGNASVELLDADGQPIPGFSGDNSAIVTGNDVRLPVTWKSGNDLTPLTGKTVQLKIHLTNAQLYAFWTE